MLYFYSQFILSDGYFQFLLLVMLEFNVQCIFSTHISMYTSIILHYWFVLYISQVIFCWLQTS